jgi:dynein heavy chain
MYEFSLTYVKKLYEQGLSKAEETSILELRIKRLNESITKVMFVNISRALFEAHKKLFSFLMCCGIKRNSKHILHR